MQVNRTLTILDLSENLFGGVGANLIGDALKVSSMIVFVEHMSLRRFQVNCTLTSLGLEYIVGPHDFQVEFISDALKVAFVFCVITAINAGELYTDSPQPER